MKRSRRDKRKPADRKPAQKRRAQNRKRAKTDPYGVTRRLIYLDHISWVQAERMAYAAQQYLTSQYSTSVRNISASAVVRMALDFLLVTYNGATDVEKAKMLNKLGERRRNSKSVDGEKSRMGKERSTEIKTEKIDVPRKDDIDRAIEISRKRGFMQEAKKEIRRDGVRISRPISPNESHKRKFPDSFIRQKDAD